MRTDELDFHLPPELIAQSPTADRSSCRLLHYRRADRSITHRTFSDLPGLLTANDLLVFNNAKVLPARFLLRKPATGGLVEGLFLQERSPGKWFVLLKKLGRGSRDGLCFANAPHIQVTVESPGEAGEYSIGLNTSEPAATVLEQVGRMPLPPYIHRTKGSDDRDDHDRQVYQTVYASVPGSVAAPTAGLHFTQQLIAELDRNGVARTEVTLHVGMGTFKPIKGDDLDAHAMHTERYEITAATAELLNTSKKKLVAVGTTAARVLESHTAGAPWTATSAETAILIRPPYQWKHVNKLITNFHLPRSTLVALVAAMVGLDEQRRIYTEAIAQKYRFFSYGDAMFID